MDSVLDRFYKLSEPFATTVPQVYRWKKGSGKLLVLGAIIHGNEPGGLKVLCSFLEELHEGLAWGEDLGEIAWFLGNLPAYKANKRYMEKDLNRCFQSSASTQGDGHNFWEEKRARELEPLLKAADRFLDLHQTQDPCWSPFFIGPWQEETFRWAKAIGHGLPLVTRQPGLVFSQEGLSSDEYTQKFGGLAITLELGRAYPEDSEAMRLGALIARETLKTPVLNSLPLEGFLQVSVIPYPTSSTDSPPRFSKAWKNGEFVKKDEIVGWLGETPIKSSQEGYVLFPQNPDKEDHPPSQEWMRIMVPSFLPPRGGWVSCP